jgi:uncharacterized OB-fold protein
VMAGAESATAEKPLPAVSFLKGIAEGDPHLEGTKCGACGAIFLDDRTVCSKCMARDQMSHVRLADSGTLYVFSIVHRSFPGIPTPYVSAVVDLDGGGTVKGNLIGIDPDPDKIKMGMPVKVVYREAPVKDAKGNTYLAYYFEPASSN